MCAAQVAQLPCIALLLAAFRRTCSRSRSSLLAAVSLRVAMRIQNLVSMAKMFSATTWAICKSQAPKGTM